MKLYIKTDYMRDDHPEARISHIRAAAKEIGYAVVPMEPTSRQKFSVDTTQLNEFCTSSRQSLQHDLGVQIYKAMIKAAEDEQ